MKTAHVIGLGKSGLGAARLLRHQGWQVWVSDGQDGDGLRSQQQTLHQEGISVSLGQPYDAQGLSPDRPHLIVVSPGVPWDIPGLVAARHQGIDVIGEMGLAWRNLQPTPWVGITGTNGKTTTTALMAAIFQGSGLHAPACGNIGYSACELALQQDQPAARNQPLDWVIAELSSYQIESGGDIAPRIGLWTTFTPDHLNRHYTLDHYFEIKAQLLDQSEIQILNGDDPLLRERALNQWPDALWTSTQGKLGLPRNGDRGFYLEDGWVMDRGEAIVEAKTLHMVGHHNQQNLLMAVAAARQAGLDGTTIAQAVAQFPGVPHRLERVRTWQGVDFINDSKATNYDAAEVGLRAVEAPVILIAGGEAKAGDDRGWLGQIQRKAAAVVLIGSAAPQFAQRLGEVGYGTVEVAETLGAAVPRSAALAQTHGAKVVLLSPACASFDQYASFEHRGDDFRACCAALGDSSPG
ncbi:UDP-N-acetylmuramoyl-L-alanine--D-glutamate ligase [Prochlorothrix hollandica]|uniref:UDP-N-acetylmuramoylalanine--D-glutamate ligase n=1 Tax=Prochlorothrix hollandica PCC 9006 = CALU 1027 TaxID=317619 RepID=A0A0M2PUR1_PROHO|nr:UDP-N-acetylmuramoyl-L-alanine--D-glutamate ligase [Prochlorothrix hollandica]KKI98126.1 UDP-N-acetylmuramoyl-L-alanyl-D-glutamate synthetase [Prochlorothrix hollandica PCC 9006 = CALU 1027]